MNMERLVNLSAAQMNYKCADDLFAALGYGETTIHKVLNKLKKPEAKPLENIAEKETYRSKKGSKKNDIIGLEGMLWSLAKCCSPIPGEPIVGVVTKSKGVSVHRLDCKCLFDVIPERMMDIKWADKVSVGAYVAHLRIESQDRVGILKDILIKIADTNTNVVYANSYLKNKKFGIIDIGIELPDIETLKKVILNIQTIQDVLSVRRLQQKNDLNALNKNKGKKTKKPNKPVS